MRRLDDDLLLSPSDLNALLDCRHLFALELARRRGEPVPKADPGPHADILARYGQEHEQHALDAYEAEGRTVERVETGRSTDELRAALAATEAAVRAGADVIHQAALADEGMAGYADFLERVERPSDLDGWSYDVADAKLASRVRTYHLVQLSAYAALLERLQGAAPEQLSVLLGSGERESYRTEDFAAYVRRLVAHARATVADGLRDTYPLPCSHCQFCDFNRACEDRRRADDHLSLVAGLRRDQIPRFEAAGIATLTGLAQLPEGARVPRIAATTLDTLRRQAALQLHERTTGERRYELLDARPEAGLALLPAPAAGDLYFDIEGDPYIGEKGLEYLFGVGWVDERGEWRYRAFWAHDRAQERAEFERLIDFFTKWRADHPGCHIHHYASYEEQALKKLAMWHATREDEVDDLLRDGALVDLYRVVRQGVRISKENYSLKEVEKFYDFVRTAEVKEAGGSIVAYERWLHGGVQADLDEIERYNDEDVQSTRCLRDWLWGLRAELGPLPVAEPRDEGGDPERVDVEAADLRERLCATGEPADALLAELLLYHRRNAKPAWWAYYKRGKMTELELLDEDTEAISGLQPNGPEGKIKQSRRVPMSFPEQRFKLAEGDEVADRFSERAAEILELDANAGTLVLKLGPRTWGPSEVPRALIPGKPWIATEQPAALKRLARSVLNVDGAHPVCEALLRRELPRIDDLATGAPLLPNGYDVDEAVSLATRLDRSVLAIQGPPGTGKTYAGARIAVALMDAGRRVGVTAQSHKVIHNLLDEIERVAAREGVEFRGFKKGDGEHAYKSAGGSIKSVSNDACEAPPADVLLIAGTSWLFAREGMEDVIDTLLIDEAGQFSLADALAVGTSARNLVLLGDPQQLAQVSQAQHPEGSDASALGHLLGEEPTIPRERGLFIDRSRRMHPDVCRFVSDTSYGGRLHSLDECARQSVWSAGLRGTGLRWIPVVHEGNSNASSEEAEEIARQIALLAGGGFTASDGTVHPLRDPERAGVMVVAPYNAQVRLLRATLDDRGLDWVEVGTVDKFQGREAAVVFFSMATSSREDMPRSADFLYSRNRLNVAVSRARALAVLVASPALLTIKCTTVEQMRLVNALCRFVEGAK